MPVFRRKPRDLAKAEPPLASTTADKAGPAAGPAAKAQVRLASVVIAVTFQRLIEDAGRAWTLEEDLVLQALRRSTRVLETADAYALSAYLSAMSEAQLRGVAANVKGIYHELLFVQAENGDWDEVQARLHEHVTHPGADVEFVVDGQVIGEVQLKAVASEAAVLEHLARYPDIDILVTAEVARRVPGVEASGFTNAELTRDVRDRLEQLRGDGLINEVTEGLATSALVSAAFLAGQAARGEGLSGRQIRGFLTDAGVGVTVATVLDALLFPALT